MGWLPASKFKELRESALVLTRDQRKELTWETARSFVACDTIEQATWAGLERRKECTPWNAVCIVRGIPQEDGDPWGDHSLDIQKMDI